MASNFEDIPVFNLKVCNPQNTYKAGYSTSTLFILYFQLFIRVLGNDAKFSCSFYDCYFFTDILCNKLDKKFRRQSISRGETIAIVEGVRA